MSFGSEMGMHLTPRNIFSADLNNGDGKRISVEFDKVELIYKENSEFSIKLGFKDNPSSKNELTLRATTLRAGQTYPIGPQDPGIKAAFALEEYIGYFPADYTGALTVERLDCRGGQIDIRLHFSIYFESRDMGTIDVVCHVLEFTSLLTDKGAAEGLFVYTPRAVDEDVPSICWIRVTGDDHVEDLNLSKINFLLFPDDTYSIKCTPPDDSDRATLTFRGGGLKSDTNYPITGPDGEPGSVEVYFYLNPEFERVSDPKGTLRVRYAGDSNEGFWFNGSFNFSLIVYDPQGNPINYEIAGYTFQAQASHVGMKP
ncbi:hypothetical protein [Pseudomonas lactucae]|uniref:hypothetical protein n=1 Tax=Pseudomonas lactucae TaxID=2813360 RepID=UPI002FCCECD0